MSDEASRSVVVQAAVGAKYTVERRLGHGGLGEVWLARDTTIDRPVAIKVLLGAAADPAQRRKLRHEARMGGQILHPHVVTLFAADVDATPPHLVMELVEGESLGRWFRAAPAPELGERLDVFRQVLAGVAAAHRAGVLHCDLKPANVVIGRDPAGRPHAKVLDFGLGRALVHARLVGDPEQLVAGTLPYMPPEQFVPGAELTPAADVYALGVVLHELLTGRTPFVERDIASYRHAHLVRPPPRLPPLPGLDRDAFDAILQRALAKLPHERFASCEAFLTALSPREDALAPTVADVGSEAPAASRFLALVAVQVRADDEDALDADDVLVARGRALAALDAAAEQAGAVSLGTSRPGERLWTPSLVPAGIQEIMRALELAAAAHEAFAGSDRGPVVLGLAVAAHAGEVLVRGGEDITGFALEAACAAADRADDGDLVVTDVIRDALPDTFASHLTPTRLRRRRGHAVGLDHLSELLPHLRGPRDETPFVGRAPELAMAEATLLKPLAGGAAALLWVRGASGAGKTRFAWHVAATLAERTPGLRVGYVSGDAAGDAPFASLRPLLLRWSGAPSPSDAPTALRRWLGDLVDNATWAADAAEALVRVLAPTALAPAGGALESLARGSQDEDWLEEVLHEVLAAEAARSRGLLLVVDAAERCDEATAKLLERALDSVRGLALLATAREDAEATASGWRLDLLRRGRTLLMAGLDVDEVSALLAGLDPAGALPGLDRHADLIHGLTAGMPLLVEELVRHLLRKAWDPETTPLESVAGVGRLANLRAWLDYRVGDLAPELREALEACAVIDPPITADALAAVAELSPRDARSRLDDLVRAGWLRREAVRTAAPVSARLAIPITASLLDSSTHGGRARARHARWADHCDAHPELQVAPERLADHRERAGQPDRAAAQWLAAAEMARSLGRPSVARERLEEAERAIERHVARTAAPAPALRRRVACETAAQAYARGAFEAALAAVGDETRVAADGAAEPEARCALWAAMAACKGRDVATALRWCDHGLSLASRLPPAGAASLLASIHQVRGFALYLRAAPGDAAAAIDPLQLALSLLPDDPAPAAAGAIHRLLLLLHLREAEVDRAMLAGEKSLLIFQRLAMPRGQALALMNLGIVHQTAGRDGESRQHYEAARDLFAAAGDDEHLAVCHHNLGDLAFQLGDLEAAEGQLLAAHACFERLGARLHLPESLLSLALVHVEAGRSDLARPLLRRAHILSSEVALTMHAARAAALLATSDAELAAAVAPLVDAGELALAAYVRATNGLATDRADRVLEALAELRAAGQSGLARPVERWAARLG